MVEVEEEELVVEVEGTSDVYIMVQPTEEGEVVEEEEEEEVVEVEEVEVQMRRNSWRRDPRG